MNVYVLIIILFLLFLLIYKIYKEYRASNTIDEKIIFWMLVSICFIPVILYYIDRSDIPSKLGWFKHSDSDKWFNFLSTYLSSILSAVIGALTMVLITIHEFKNIKQNDSEQKRINNMPLISYGFSIYGKYNATPFIDLCKKKSSSLFLDVSIKNIGMNTLRKFFINISTNLVPNDYDYRLDDQLIIEKDCKKNIVFKIPVSKTENSIKLTVKYQDILFNWYEQEVNVNLNNIEFHKDDRDYVEYVTADISTLVNDEKLIGDNINLNENRWSNKC